MMPTNPLDENEIKKWFTNPDREHIQQIIEEVKNGYYDGKWGMGYGFHVKENHIIKIADEDGEEEEIKTSQFIILPAHNVITQDYTGDVKFEYQATSYKNKLIEAVYRGAVLPNWFTWEISLKNLGEELVGYTPLEGEYHPPYSKALIELKTLKCWVLPYPLSELIELFLDKEAQGLNHITLDEAFHKILTNFLEKYPQVKNYDKDRLLNVIGSLFETFGHQVAGAIIAGLFDAPPIVKTGYNEELLEDKTVKEALKHIWIVREFIYVDFDQYPEKPVERMFQDIALPSIDPPEVLRDVVLFNVQWANKVNLIKRSNFEFIRRFLPDFSDPMLMSI